MISTLTQKRIKRLHVHDTHVDSNSRVYDCKPKVCAAAIGICRHQSILVLPASSYSYITPQGMLIGVHTMLITLFFLPVICH
jgi:hypothetical protein